MRACVRACVRACHLCLQRALELRDFVRIGLPLPQNLVELAPLLQNLLLRVVELLRQRAIHLCSLISRLEKVDDGELCAA